MSAHLPSAALHVRFSKFRIGPAQTNQVLEPSAHSYKAGSLRVTEHITVVHGMRHQSAKAQETARGRRFMRSTPNVCM
jgi:hypothetical protein